MKGEAACPAMVVMAKQPSGGSVKTRLASALTAAQRSTLYRAFLLDRVDQLRRLRGVHPYVAFTPAEAEHEIRSLLPPGIRLLAQRGAHLGERLANASAALFERGCPAVVLVDSDTPTLPTGALQESVDALAGKREDEDAEPRPDVVLGPAWDGGYYLIGTRRPQPSLFVDIAWSGPLVLGQTVARAERAGLSIRQLRPWYDIDTPQDLGRLAGELQTAPPWRPDYPRRTAAVVAELRLLARSAS